MEVVSFVLQLLKSFLSVVRLDSWSFFSASLVSVLGVSLLGVMVNTLVRVLRR